MAGIDAEAIAGELDSSLENIFPDDPGTMEPLGPDLGAMEIVAGSGSASASSGEAFDLEDVAAAARTLARPCRRTDQLRLRRPRRRG